MRRPLAVLLALLAIGILSAVIIPAPSMALPPAASSRIPASEFTPVTVGAMPVVAPTEPARSSGPATSGQDRSGPAAPSGPVRHVQPRRAPLLAGVAPVAASPSTTGVASWFASPIGVSAAGPRLRSALGPAWRGTRVRVCTATACATTMLGDWMRADRLIDLDAPIFARLAPLSAGLVLVTVTPILTPPETATGGTP